MDEPREFLNEKEAADLLRVSPRTLANLRVTGGGPPFTRVGGTIRGRILYERAQLVAYLASRRRRSTSESAAA
jgi:hypothetical protein